MLELEMANDCYAFIKEKDQYKKVVREIPFLSRCIDMILVSKNDEIETIEFKLTKWREAIEQAKNHKLGADRAYICLPKRKPSPTLIEALEEANIGLYLYCPDDECKMQKYLTAQNNSKIDVFQSILKKNINKIASCY